MTRQELFEVRVEVEFEANHALGPDGEEVPLHSHRWQVAVRARSEKLDPIAIVVDFRVLRDDAERLVGTVAGQQLDGHPALAGVPATPAAIGQWILRALEADARGADYRIEAVEVECDPGIRWVIGRETVAARHPV